MFGLFKKKEPQWNSTPDLLNILKTKHLDLVTTRLHFKEQKFENFRKVLERNDSSYIWEKIDRDPEHFLEEDATTYVTVFVDNDKPIIILEARKQIVGDGTLITVIDIKTAYKIVSETGDLCKKILEAQKNGERIEYLEIPYRLSDVQEAVSAIETYKHFYRDCGEKVSMYAHSIITGSVFSELTIFVEKDRKIAMCKFRLLKDNEKTRISFLEKIIDEDSKVE